MKPGIDWRRVFIITGLAGLVVIYALLFVRLLSTPAEATGSDFISAYTGGRVADLWGPDQVYNLDDQQAVQAQVVGFALAPGEVLMFNHPPYLVPLLAVLMDRSYLASLARYAVLMALIYAFGMLVAWSWLRLEGWARSPTWLALAGMVTFYPLFVSLLNTQDTALLVLGGLLWLLGLRQKKDLPAGLGLALTTVRPHLALLLALPFLFHRRRVFWGFCVGALGLGAVSLLSVGAGGLQAYLHLLLTAAGGEWFGMHESSMVNLLGLLTRLFPQGGSPIHWIAWGAYAAALAAACIVWACSRDLDERAFGILVLAALFFAPHLHYHDLAFLLVALLPVMTRAVRAGSLRPATAVVVLLAVSFVLLLGWMVPAVRFDVPFLLMAWLAWALGRPERAFFWQPGKEANA